MSRTALAFVLALLAVAFTPATASPDSGPPSFTSYLVDEAISTGEPGLWLDTGTPTPTAWMHAPAEGIWRSTNGGAAWSKAAQYSTSGVWTGGDSSLASDDNGVLYLSGLLDSQQALATTIPVQVSLDDGSTWIRLKELAPTATGVACDRQWTAARGNGESVTTARCGSQGHLWRTTDAGVTYQGPFVIETGVGQMGPVFYSPDGNLYTTYWDFDEIRIARSADGGLTWTNFRVAGLRDTRSFTVAAADSAGNLYAAWEDAHSFFGIEPAFKSYIYMATSQDDGATWSAPRLVSNPSRTSIFPWIVALAPGKVDVAYYEEEFVSGVTLNAVSPSDLGGPTTTWDVMMAQSLNALATSPTFQRIRVADNFHTGSICTSGLSCVGTQNLLQMGNAPTPMDRRYLDYFEMRVDAAGYAYIAYGTDRPVTSCLSGGCFIGDLFFSWIDFRIAKQTGGTTIA